MSSDHADQRYMAQALRLARRGLNTCHPNPRVGCVIVRAGEIVGQGWHEMAGGPHAEVGALAEAGAHARGATAYVTLEPCSHHGRTAPCADALIKSGIARVVAAMVDPYDAVAGAGLARLEQAGVEVVCGVLETQARELNAGFISRCERGRPWLRLKLAASMDGRTALRNRVSQWITGAAAREDVHRWRARASAIMTGSGTLLADDPELTARVPGVAAQPLRIIVDSHWQTPVTAHIFDSPGPVLVAGVGSGAVPEALAASPAETLVLPGIDGHVDLPALLNELGRREINELHVECGARLAGALLQEGLVDELLIYMAPAIMGADARGMFELPGFESMQQVQRLQWVDIRRLGADLRLLARPVSETD